MEKEIARKLKTIGANIRRRRIESKLELKDIAYRMKLTPQAYGNIENGKTNINFSHIYTLSKIFKTTFLETLDNAANSEDQEVNNPNKNGSVILN